MGHYDCKSCHATPYEEHSADCERFGAEAAREDAMIRITPNQAARALEKARQLQIKARSNRGKASLMQPDCKTANELRARAYRQEDQAHDMFTLVSNFIDQQWEDTTHD